MKSLIITPFFKPNIGGAETFAEDLAKFLAKKGTVHICTIKWKKPVQWQGMNLWKGAYFAWRLFPSLLKMKKCQYDRVYALGIISSFLCAILGIKYSAVILALYDFKKPHWFRFFLNRAETVFVEGVKGEEDMKKMGITTKIIQFQHWCDQEHFFYKERNNERLKVLFVGRPIPIKGKHIIKKCEQLTKDIDYEYIESIPYEDMPKYYQGADVCVVPSLYSEGFSRVVIEAASCGCILITSNKGSLPDMVMDFGFVVEPTPLNFKYMLDTIKVVNRKELQEKTAKYALENFSEKNAEVFI